MRDRCLSRARKSWRACGSLIFPFLADKLVWERTVNAFTEAHPELEVTYIYTGPSELNTKKKTHLLLYVFTEPRQDH